MILYNCHTQLEKDLKATDLTKLTVDKLLSLAVDIQTDFMNDVLQNDIIATDALVQIASELASRCKGVR